MFFSIDKYIYISTDSYTSDYAMIDVDYHCEMNLITLQYQESICAMLSAIYTS